MFNDCGVAIEAARRRMAFAASRTSTSTRITATACSTRSSGSRRAFADLHEDGRFLYPGTGSRSETGRGAAAGTKLNMPMPPGRRRHAFLAAWEEVERYLDEAAPS